MKTNKMMRIASVLLVAVLLTTCVISGTFAKYVTTGPAATDSARVAKWGVDIEATGVMFNDSYKNEATTYDADEEGDAITVQANTEDTNIVAPGTKGNLAAISVTGTPEVDVRVSYVATLELANWTVDGAYYCPLEIKVGDDVLKGNDYASMDEFEADVKTKIEAKTADYDANTDLSTVVNDDVVVSWEWKFEGNDDAKDTALGDAATAATVALTITTTITQID